VGQVLGLLVAVDVPLAVGLVAGHEVVPDPANPKLASPARRRIPTPRWTAYDAAYAKIRIDDPKVPMTTQERAYTSPIWYTP
jgi:hypothetical protein